jgi:hypothetical protein
MHGMEDGKVLTSHVECFVLLHHHITIIIVIVIIIILLGTLFRLKEFTLALRCHTLDVTYTKFLPQWTGSSGNPKHPPPPPCSPDDEEITVIGPSRISAFTAIR